MYALISIGLFIAAIISNPKPDVNHILIASSLFAVASGLGSISARINKLSKTESKDE